MFCRSEKNGAISLEMRKGIDYDSNSECGIKGKTGLIQMGDPKAYKKFGYPKEV